MIPHGSSFNWIIAPASSCISYVAEETVNAAILQRSITNLAGMRVFLEIGRQKFLEAGAPTSGIDKLLQAQDFHEQKANEILRADFSAINSHALIGLWCAVETAVEDTVVLIIMNEESSLDILRRSGFKTKGEQNAPLTEEKARKLYRSLESQARNDKSVGRAYIQILNALGLKVEAESPLLDCLSEINFVRNCILHRGGILDSKVHTEAPGLADYENKQLPITSSRYEQYYNSVGDFAIALLNAALDSCYVQSK